MGLVNPMSESTHAFEASKCITAPLVALIVAQTPYQAVQRDELQKKKNCIKKRRRELQEQHAQDIQGQLNPQLQRSAELSRERGASA